MNIDREVALMKLMSVGELRKKYCEVFKEPTNARNKVWLIKRIAWRMQANIEGDLSERARRRAMEIANDADIRMMPPRERKPRKFVQQPNTVVVNVDSKPTRSLSVGQSLQRVYKGQNIVVVVRSDGFEWQGQKYKSLTAVAKAVTGKHWNGFNFFRVDGGKT
ncbi:DUF2924 domain-containing protein [Pirellulaceae bacterium SH501]